MIMSRKKFLLLWAALLVPFALLGLWLSRLDRGLDTQLHARQGEPLRIAVLDPLCDNDLPDLRRDYTPLGTFLEKALDRRVELRYARHLREVFSPESPPDLIIGSNTTTRAEADETKEAVRPVARLTDDRGATDLSGLFVVRADDPATGIGDLADHRIVFGSSADPERHADALTTLSHSGIAPVPPLKEISTCREALQILARREADAAVISSYAFSVLESESTAGGKSFRVVGRTTPQPFITAFVTSRIGPSVQQTITEALLSLQTHALVLGALKSQAGFIPWQEKSPEKKESSAPLPVAQWTDWRGPGRAGQSPDVPERLPSSVKFLWKRGLTGAGLAGVAATTTHVIVADKSAQKDQDLWRCLDADTGKELWTIAYATPQQMEFTNVPRAAPVIHGSFVYVLGAFGDLHCVSLFGSGIVWRRNILKDFNASLPNWGTCSTPLVSGDCLIVNPGAAEASLVALGLYTGEVIWKTPGKPPGYGSFILGTFGGVHQIVGCDAESLGGWNPTTGQRLWTLTPEKKGDYNVPTPVNVFGLLLAATENNGTRLYDFDSNGRILPVPVAQTRELAPDTSTPVVIDGLVFGCSRGLFCLDLNENLKTRYVAEKDGAFKEHAAFITGKGRVLAITVGGELILFKATPDAFTPISRLRVFDGTEVWSHPALVGNRLYLRSMNEICCLLLDD